MILEESDILLPSTLSSENGLAFDPIDNMLAATCAQAWLVMTVTLKRESLASLAGGNYSISKNLCPAKSAEWNCEKRGWVCEI